MTSHLTRFVGGAALGAAVMYMLDPDKGRRRRALVGDKVASVGLDTRRALRAAGRDAAHRLTGLGARARHLLTDEPIPDDLQLIERVRARMGRLVSHPHAIQVGANHGRVTLSGPVLRHEVQRLVDAVRSVWGVHELDNKLVVYDDADSISSLQGGERPEPQRSYEVWTPSTRGAAIVCGSLLSLMGLADRSVLGLALAAGGAALAVRGATNRPLFAQDEGSIDERMLPIRAEDARRDVGIPGTPTTAPRTTA
jgi:hypothetical protein